ncbi:MAG TPA: hypothetical protein VGR29_01735, partial [Thermomicrobiales bacterium]|nr:hypothetical protein [Thermomicrobiales bacterium]
AVTLIVGTADYTINIGDFALNGIALGTFGSIILYQVFRLIPGSMDEDPGATPASAGLDDEYGGAAAGPGVRWNEEERFVSQRRERSGRQERGTRDSRREQRLAPQREETFRYDEVDMDDSEATRSRQPPRRPQQRPQPARREPADEFGFGEPPETPPTRRGQQPAQGQRRPRPQEDSRRASSQPFQESGGYVVDDPDAMPRDVRSPRPSRRQEPRESAPVREDIDDFGFDAPMPLPQPPQPPRARRGSPPPQDRRRPRPEGDKEPPRRGGR